ncbi:bfr-2 [Neurospora crassa OR74A]|uniref:Protein bfr2 n=1 Tax=Neurospora crassa (strain ATCC 24698 / 74-OR23-1A / CBS 708.71 / DSM 1257 / FGSC 987) TaxID=367110 RepID=BFR2_NEUCR|nr:bfr-2 [Neurospora crassa OR74A]Q7S6P8.1 RecName: Full=Protein bfr2 [Neurospora crassa OR74A]pir/T51893/ related to Che-1 protein [imported] - Neurospora crassa [Neurospora crassa]EAA31177.3 bfr-2 [Neurospora crassa OR74A]CAE85565.1 related to Che-1 protein [Neurospora crassa]|eukprot:XP_960413.3 bfr-2 [Neurospora crassa OR74A]
MPLYTTKKSNKLRASMFDEKPAKDYDPEAEPRDGDDDQSGSEADSDVERAETEHYVTVGKSKLRKAEAPTLGPEYSGTRVSRKALEESDEEDFEDEEEDDEEDDDDEDDLEDGESETGSEEFADPDTADLERDHIDEDAEISSDNALGEDDADWAEKFTFRGSSKPKTPAKTSKKDDLAVRIKKRPTAADFMSGSEDDEEEEDDEEDLEEDEEDEEDSEEGEQNGLFDMEAEETEDDEGEDDEEELDGALLSGSDDEEGDSEEDDEDDEEGSGDEDEDEDDEDEDEDEDDESGDDDEKNDVNAELRKIMAEDEKKIVSTFSKAAEADAQKGVAVRSQRRIFDSILNLRIRLQKALIAANTFNCVEKPENFKEKPYEAAEEAAVKLWNTIDSVRNSFLPEQVKAKAGEKRKRDAIELDTPAQEIWEVLEAVEGPANKYRRQVLDKWSTRVRSTTASMTKERRLAQSAGSQSLVSVLDDQLLSADRLIKKARTPRSCAPAQAAKKVEEDADIYDDADFYQLLLKELVDQRSSDSAAPGESVATVRWAALKEAKTRKQVDRKASKGRKLRFTVHEKLQNFMAPEDRRSWEEHAIDRFFGTLFGQKMVLKEDEAEAEAAEEDEEMGGVNVEEAGLKLFRS